MSDQGGICAKQFPFEKVDEVGLLMLSVEEREAIRDAKKKI